MVDQHSTLLTESLDTVMKICQKYKNKHDLTAFIVVFKNTKISDSLEFLSEQMDIETEYTAWLYRPGGPKYLAAKTETEAKN